MDALRQPTIRVVAIIAEGVPERDTKQVRVAEGQWAAALWCRAAAR